MSRLLAATRRVARLVRRRPADEKLAHQDPPLKRHGLWVYVLAGSSLVLAGCSPASDIVLDDPSPSVLVGTETPRSTSDGSETSVPDTPVTSSTSASTVTTAGISTTTNAVVITDQVIAAHKAVRSAYTVCGADPPTCDVGTLAVPGSPAYVELQTFWAQLAADGLRTRPSPELTYDVYEQVRVAPDGTTATIVACTVDGGQTYRPAAGKNGEDLIVNALVSSSRGEWDFAREASGSWRFVDGRRLEAWRGENRCPAKPSS